MSRHKQHSFAVPWFAATRYPCLSRPVLIIAGVLPKDAVDRIQKPAATRHRSGLAENPTLCQIARLSLQQPSRAAQNLPALRGQIANRKQAKKIRHALLPREKEDVGASSDKSSMEEVEEEDKMEL